MNTKSSNKQTGQQFEQDFHKLNPSRKRTYELENEAMHARLTEASPKFMCGLNFYTYTSNFRVLVELLTELTAGVFFVLYLLNDTSLDHVLYTYCVKHLVLLPDFIYNAAKGALHFNDLIFGIADFLYFGFFGYCLIYPENDSVLYIASISKLSVDIILYSTAVAFRDNPVSLNC